MWLQTCNNGYHILLPQSVTGQEELLGSLALDSRGRISSGNHTERQRTFKIEPYSVTLQLCVCDH